MSTQTQLDYREVQTVGLVAVTKVLDERGRPYTDWYAPKLRSLQMHVGMLASEEWSVAREHFQITAPDVEHGMVTGYAEVMEDLIAHPNPDTGIYASNLNPRPKPGKYPLWIVNTVLGERLPDGRYTIEQVKGEEMPNFPRESGILTENIPQLGLIQGAYLANNDDFARDEGLRAVIRGDQDWVPLVGGSTRMRAGGRRIWIGVSASAL